MSVSAIMPSIMVLQHDTPTKGSKVSSQWACAGLRLV